MSAWRNFRKKRRHVKKINKRLSVESLQREYEKTKTQIEILEEDITRNECEEKKYSQLQSQIEQRTAKLRYRKEVEVYGGPIPSNIFLKFIKKNQFSDTNKLEISRIDQEIANISVSNPYKNEGYRVNSFKYQIKVKADYLAKIKEAIRKKEVLGERKKQKQEKVKQYRNNLLEQLNLTRAIAAESIKKVRRQAQSKKHKLEMPESCPYCSNSLIGNEVHVDHIYPVSKGGKSINSNMVNVCASCNAKKKNMTLGVFINFYSLDYDAIRNNLSGLKKDF